MKIYDGDCADLVARSAREKPLSWKKYRILLAVSPVNIIPLGFTFNGKRIFVYQIVSSKWKNLSRGSIGGIGTFSRI